ncbi:hypothetical protein PENSPDRAFT_591594, partial [Peniophora sp. CONT]
DWPPTDHFATTFPDMFKVFQDCLVAPWLTYRDGILNLESSMPKHSCPKGYLAQGAADNATTFFHCDIADAVNIMFNAGRAADGSEGGALWTMVARDDMARAEELLRERKSWDDNDGHPVHAQRLDITGDDVAFLREQGLHVWTFVQRAGEAVFIPAGVGHQVKNLSSCIKVAVDFVAPCNVLHSQKIGRQLREHRLAVKERSSDDVLQLEMMCWWYYRRSQSDLRDVRRDPASNPWTCEFSAAPRYLSTSVPPSGARK